LIKEILQKENYVAFVSPGFNAPRCFRFQVADGSSKEAVQKVTSRYIRFLFAFPFLNARIRFDFT